jgi:hypothetical protein
MTDREMLELAAKAAGLTPWYVLRGKPGWNPLEDDGDALRLAVKLRVLVDCEGYEDVAAVVEGGSGAHVVEPFGDDRCAATRRAIVRAAAEIGRAMP